MSEQEYSQETPESPEPQAPPPPPAAEGHGTHTSYSMPARPMEMSKNPGLAALLSAIPGLGNIYNGLYMRGFAIFAIFVSLIGAVATIADTGEEENLAFLIPTMIFFWFFNVFDAYRQATLINRGMGPDLGMADQPGSTASAGLVPGVVLLVIGSYGLLSRYADIDLSWVFDQWPIVLLGFGGFLVWRAVQARKEASDSRY